jgi:hypothetical protein
MSATIKDEEGNCVTELSSIEKKKNPNLKETELEKQDDKQYLTKGQSYSTGSQNNALGRHIFWQRAHYSLYLLGGLSFLIGSSAYFPTDSNWALGGWGFTAGSICYVTADGIELYDLHGNDIMLLLGGKQSLHQKSADIESNKPTHVDTSKEIANTHEQIILSVVTYAGNIIYLAGGVCFIPSLGQLTNGAILFIAASAVLMLAQIIRLHRRVGSLMTSLQEDHSKSVDIPPEGEQHALMSYGDEQDSVDISAIAIILDVLVLEGAAAYLVGSICFLPQYSASIDEAAWLYLCGGIVYFFFSLCIYFRKFPLW